jgi:hypothetical protein
MMDHKAFLFDFDRFDRELRPLLESALWTGDFCAMISFIDEYRANLRDPYEGEPLGEDWRNMLEVEDAHQFGDFALTMYYDPRENIGLGGKWERIQDLVAGDGPGSSILGSPMGPSKAPFDPGKMGSYFQSANQVREHHAYLLDRVGRVATPDELVPAIAMLAAALDARTGLYVTF